MDHNGVWYLGLQLKTNKDEELPLAFGINIKPLEKSQRSQMLLSFPFFKAKKFQYAKKAIIPFHFTMELVY